MAIKKLSPKFLIASITLIVGMLLLLWQENAPVWLVYSLILGGFIFIKPVFDGWLLPFWKLLIGRCGVILLLEFLLIVNKVFV